MKKIIMYIFLVATLASCGIHEKTTETEEEVEDLDLGAFSQMTINGNTYDVFHFMTNTLAPEEGSRKSVTPDTDSSSETNIFLDTDIFVMDENKTIEISFELY